MGGPTLIPSGRRPLSTRRRTEKRARRKRRSRLSTSSEPTDRRRSQILTSPSPTRAVVVVEVAAVDVVEVAVVGEDAVADVTGPVRIAVIVTDHVKTAVRTVAM